MAWLGSLLGRPSGEHPHDNAVTLCLQHLLGDPDFARDLRQLAARRAQLPCGWAPIGSRVSLRGVLVIGARHPRTLATPRTPWPRRAEHSQQVVAVRMRAQERMSHALCEVGYRRGALSRCGPQPQDAQHGKPSCWTGARAQSGGARVGGKREQQRAGFSARCLPCLCLAQVEADLGALPQGDAQRASRLSPALLQLTCLRRPAGQKTVSSSARHVFVDRKATSADTPTSHRVLEEKHADPVATIAKKRSTAQPQLLSPQRFFRGGAVFNPSDLSGHL